MCTLRVLKDYIRNIPLSRIPLKMLKAAMLSCHVTFDCGSRLRAECFFAAAAAAGERGGGGGGVTLEVRTGKLYENTPYNFHEILLFFQESGSSKSSGKSPYSIATDSMHVCLVSR